MAERHRSLKSVFDGSWNLLSRGQQAALARLSMFPDKFHFAAAEWVSQTDLHTTMALLNKALVEQTASQRLSLHAAVREFAKEKLAARPRDARDAGRRHSSFYLDMVRGAFQRSAEAGQTRVLDDLQVELPNIRTAWWWAIENDAGDVLEKTIDPLFYFLVLRALYQDGIVLFAAKTDNSKVSLHLASVLANCLVHQGELARAEAVASQVVEQARVTPRARSHANQALGNISHSRGDWDSARTRYECALQARVDVKDLIGACFSATSLAALHLLRDDASASRAYVKTSFRLSREASNPHGLMLTHYVAGDLAIREERLRDARLNFENCLRLEETVHNAQIRAGALLKLGKILTALHESPVSSASYRREAFELSSEVGDPRLKALALVDIGRAELLARDHGRARDILLGAARLGQRLGVAPVIRQAVHELAEVELAVGNRARAERLMREIEFSESSLAPGRGDAPSHGPRPTAEGKPELASIGTVLDEMFSEQEYESLRL